MAHQLRISTHFVFLVLNAKFWIFFLYHTNASAAARTHQQQDSVDQSWKMTRRSFHAPSGWCIMHYYLPCRPLALPIVPRFFCCHGVAYRDENLARLKSQAS
jgi:hypothetical protein